MSIYNVKNQKDNEIDIEAMALKKYREQQISLLENMSVNHKQKVSYSKP